MARTFVQNLAQGTFIAFIIAIALSYMFNQYFQTPILKGGVILILLAVAVLLSMAWGVATEGRITIDNIVNFVLILICLIAIIVITKVWLPEIYSIVPDQAKAIFSIVGP